MMVTWANCYYDDGDDDDEGVIGDAGLRVQYNVH